MMRSALHGDALDLLSHARSIADHALAVGYKPQPPRKVPTSHIGAALADAVLQAGVNYRTVVKPRIDRILTFYPECMTLAGTGRIVEQAAVHEFLLWKHHEKVERFVRLHDVLHAHDVEDAADLRAGLMTKSFRLHLLQVKGIGNKTVDYLSCLVGIDTIAVDRHVRGFAAQAGIRLHDYDRLHAAFCYAADLLDSSRREFDAWIWKYVSLDARARAQHDFFAI